MWLCDPHGEMVVGTGASTPEHIQALCSVAGAEQSATAPPA